MSVKTGAHGWPLVPSTAFPVESMLACPKCGKSNIRMSSIGCGIGSGRGGSHRMGDNYKPIIECKECGYMDIGKERMHTVFGPSVEVG